MNTSTPTLMRPRRMKGRAAGLALVLLSLAGCGGDADDAEPPAVAAGTVPDSAIASAPAYARFAATLPLDDRAQPLQLGDWAAPTSETGLPEPVL